MSTRPVSAAPVGFAPALTPHGRLRFELSADAPGLPEHELAKVMHVELPILDGHVLMGTDMLESMGHELRIGNNTTLNLEPDTKAATERLFAALSEGGSDTVGLDPMPWGSLWGVTLDRFGVRWMFNVSLEAD